MRKTSAKEALSLETITIEGTVYLPVIEYDLPNLSFWKRFYLRHFSSDVKVYLFPQLNVKDI